MINYSDSWMLYQPCIPGINPTWSVKQNHFLVCFIWFGCESWTIKKGERWRIDAFQLWCWKKVLRVPWTARTSNQSILKEISPEYSLEGLAEAETLILWLPDAKNWLIWKDPDSGNDWRQKGTTEDEMGGWHHRLNGHVWVSSRSWWWTGRPGVLQSWGRKESDMTERLNWRGEVSSER